MCERWSQEGFFGLCIVVVLLSQCIYRRACIAHFLRCLLRLHYYCKIDINPFTYSCLDIHHLESETLYIYPFTHSLYALIGTVIETALSARTTQTGRTTPRVDAPDYSLVY